MNALEKLKLSKELRSLLGGMDGLKAMEKLKAAKRVRELVALLGGGSNVRAPADQGNSPFGDDAAAGQSSSNPLYQSVIDGAGITVDLLEKVIAEAEANGDDQDNAQLVQVAEVVQAWALQNGFQDAT